MAEQRFKTCPTEAEPGHKQTCGLLVPGEGHGLLALAQSTAIARAGARICKEERVRFGVVSGHDRKTLTLSAGRVTRGSASVRRERLLLGCNANRARPAWQRQHDPVFRLCAGPASHPGDF